MHFHFIKTNGRVLSVKSVPFTRTMPQLNLCPEGATRDMEGISDWSIGFQQGIERFTDNSLCNGNDIVKVTGVMLVAG